MTRNVGSVDRGLRIAAGLALIGAALGLWGPEFTTPWGYIGIVPIVTALVGWCPAYALVGLKTCKA